MVRNIQRKIVAMMVFLILPFYMQAMIITPEQTTMAAGTVGTIASLCVLAQSIRGQENLGAILGTGVVLGGASYLGFREYTPEQITKRAGETVEEMEGTNLRNLVFKNTNYPISVDKITGAYGGFNFFENASYDIDKYKSRLRYHLKQFKKAQLDGSRLQHCYDRLEEISTVLPQCKDAMTNLLDIQKEINKNKKIQSKMQNEEREVEIKNQEANIKWWETYLNVAKWSYPKLITSGLALCFFAWTLKLPYPSFSR